MISEQTEEFYDLLAEMFLKLLFNPPSEDAEDAWGVHPVSLLMKVKGAKHIKHFRPIGVLPVLYTLYSRTLMLLASPHIDNIGPINLFFRKGHQAGEPLHIIRSLIEKANEWAQPIFAADADIHKAYDFVSHPKIVHALRRS
jgi:hypothetical protein